MLIDLFRNKPYDREPEVEDEDLQDQQVEQEKCQYYKYAKSITIS